MKNKLKKALPQMAYFYGHLRYRLIILIVVSILVALLDGLSLAMFIPLLQLVANQDAQATSEQMGNLSFVLGGAQALGLPLTLTVVLITMLVFFIFKGLAKYILSYLNTIYRQFFVRRIRVENINALTAYSYQAFVTADAGAIQNTLSGEVERVVQAFGSYTQVMQQVVMVLTYAALAFLANPGFAVLVVAGGVLSNILFSFIYKKTKFLSGQVVKSNHAFQGLLIQNVAFFKYLKATGFIADYADNLKTKVYEIEDRMRKIGILQSIMQGVREPIMMGIVAAVILIQVNLFGANLSAIILSLLFFFRGLISVTNMQTNYSRFLVYSGSIDNMVAFIADLKANREHNGKQPAASFSKEIEFQNLSFGYQPDVPILKEINLKIYRFETLAFVGESGSGKTTLINILTGLLKPTKGRILIDNVDSQELDIHSFQRRIGYITQEPVIFDDTIYNNVTFWAEKNKINLQRFWNALKKANITDFVKEQPNAEDARLGNNGINLSGGQKQRISIARELYKEVEFLLMDEATSALDSETEFSIQQNIDQLKGRFTILIIAHRLSTIRNADRVVVLKNGCIEHIGSFENLIKQSDSFQRMVELQEL